MDLSARKLQVWIQKILLSVRPGTEEKKEEDGGDGEEGGEGGRVSPNAKEVDPEGCDKIDPIEAVVRIKIPKVKPDE